MGTVLKYDEIVVCCVFAGMYHIDEGNSVVLWNKP